MLYAFGYPLCLKLCWHNQPGPKWGSMNQQLESVCVKPFLKDFYKATLKWCQQDFGICFEGFFI